MPEPTVGSLLRLNGNACCYLSALTVGGLGPVFPKIVVLAHVSRNRTGIGIEEYGPEREPSHILKDIGVLYRIHR